MARVECPRCRLRLTARLHMLADAQPCPRCWESDRFEVPMFFVLGPRPSSPARRR